MATSPNFNWPEPDNTDLVKNGALAIRTAVNAIDSSLVDLKGGTTGQVLAKASGTDMDFSWVAQDDSNAIQNAIVDAKGDIIAATADDTPARLAVGANDTVLTADSTTATGLKWATVAGGGYTSIASGSLSGSSVAMSSIPATYRDLVLIFRDYYFVNDDLITGTINGTNSIYTNQVTGNGDAPMTSGYVVPTQSENTDNSDQNNFMMLRFYDYANTTSHKIVDSWVIQRNSGNTNYRLLNTTTGIRLTAAINSIVFGTQTGGNISGGTYVLYGVK
jgi:hypothetical protein